jgi:ERCC4-type nuclease
MIVLKIDTRENKLKPYFETNNVPHIVEQLVHGDIQLWYEDKPIFCFERKTTDDLLASIKDGRYKNQKLNCIQSGFRVDQYYYIIEGTIKWNGNSKVQNDKIVQGAIINTNLRDKIGTFFTKNYNETYECIKGIYDRLCKDPNKYLEGLDLKQTINTCSTNEKTSKKDCFIYQLCQIPEISEKTAEAIWERFKSMKQLIKEGLEMTEEERIKALSEIKMGEKQRKISSKAVTSLNNYLFIE